MAEVEAKAEVEKKEVSEPVAAAGNVAANCAGAAGKEVATGATGAGVLVCVGFIGPGPSIKLDPRVNPHVAQVTYQLGDQSNQREKVQRAQHHGVIAADDALVAQQPQAV